MTPTPYAIKEGYFIREQNEAFDDTPFKDEWQDGVYKHARELFDQRGFRSVVDFGCGSGYKLLKYFSEFFTLGVEVEPTVTWLQEKYPERNWAQAEYARPWGYDLAISADVIEHLPDPDVLLDTIQAAGPKLIVLSTPDRALMAPEKQDGPPHNVAHVREWTFQEFENYIGSRFEVLDHFIANREQMTQVIVAKLRTGAK
jgi:SAM-dependent methyltransferase